MGGVIRNRKPTWEKELRIKDVLRDLQMLVRMCDVLDLPAEHFANLIYFVLDQFPVSEGSIINGYVTDEWAEFEDGIPDYSIHEFYSRVMRPCENKEDK